MLHLLLPTITSSHHTAGQNHCPACFSTATMSLILTAVLSCSSCGEREDLRLRPYSENSETFIDHRLTVFFSSADAMLVERAILDCWDGGKVDDLVGFVLSVICLESGFRRNAVGSSGEVGYMQVSKWWAKEFGLSEDDLFFPYTNVCAGLRILSKYYEATGDIFLTLAKYNGGAKAKRLSPSYASRFFKCAERVQWQNNAE